MVTFRIFCRSPADWLLFLLHLYQTLIDATDIWQLRFPDTQFEKYKAEWTGNIKEWGEIVDVWFKDSSTTPLPVDGERVPPEETPEPIVRRNTKRIKDVFRAENN